VLGESSASLHKIKADQASEILSQVLILPTISGRRKLDGGTLSKLSFAEIKLLPLQ
jgi:hypothetical protein